MIRIWLLSFALYAAPAIGDDDIVTELAMAELPDPPMEDPPIEAMAIARTKRLQAALRCPVCQGLSVAASPSTAARAMGDRIEELVRSGYTEDQITEYFVDRYGAWVELEPPADQHRALFYAPLAAVSFGALMVFVLGRKRQAEHLEPDLPKASSADDSLAPWRARILAELGDE